MVNEHTESFAGLPVFEFTTEYPLNPEQHAYRISVSFDEQEEGVTWTDRLDAYLQCPDAPKTKALVVGCWEECGGGTDSAMIVEALVAARDRLPKLTAILLGDIVGEESEISWINQSDLSPLFTAFPDLQCLWVRGGQGLSLGTLKLPKLEELRVQTGGLPASVVREVARASLPNLVHLELWLGSGNYGWDGSLDDLKPILAGDLLPKLRYLGLKNSEIQDEIAIAASVAPIVERLEVLDLSMGILSDKGAEALVASKSINKLKKLDLHHHYLSEAMWNRLDKLDVDVDVSDAQDASDPEDRYIEVSE